MVRSISVAHPVLGLLLAIIGLALLLLDASPPAAAENLTVTATVNETSSFSLSATNVSLPAGNPGATVESSPINITATTNRTGSWAVQLRAATDSLVGPNSASIPISNLQWKIDTGAYTQVSTTDAAIASGTGATPNNGYIYQLALKLTYPLGKPAGTYSVNLILTFS